MTALTVDSVRDCLEGAVPSVLATCSADGVPNVAYLSQVEYVDSRHIALSFQFFNKTRQNILANAAAELLIVHPLTAAMYRLRARYLRTETEGPLFERMKAKLAGIASHTGMAGVFKLLGSDVYEVLSVESTGTRTLAEPPPGLNRLAALRRALARLSRASDLEALLDELLATLGDDFGIGHAMVLMLDASRERLYTVASRGYGASGVGSEIGVGQGVIGVAARMRTPIRISHLTADRAYSQAMRAELRTSGETAAIEREIPWPGLAEPHSQLAVPIGHGDELLGVLFVESGEDLRFGYDDEDALLGVASHLAVAMRQFQVGAEGNDEPAGAPPAVLKASPAGAPLRVRYYDQDCSVFLGDDYLIKGVAGSVLWKLLRDHQQHGRTEFSNRELRRAPDIRLPDLGDNLEARLILLTRRLVERDACLRIEKTGRGRFRLRVHRPLLLEVVQQRV
jgi:adenylate cyclase